MNLTRPILPFLLLLPSALANPPKDAVERGRKALQTRAFNSPAFSRDAFENAWKVWGLREKPADYDRRFRERYGLHEAPFDNGDYPMGLRESTRLFISGVTTDCMACHGGSILGKSYVGLGNASGDYHALLEELSIAGGKSGKLPFHFARVRGTSEAFAMDVFLLSLREPDLSLRTSRLDLGLHDDMCEDTPAWWLLKKKKTMYHHGGMDTRSVRALMQFMLSPINLRVDFEREEATFADIRAYLMSIEAPPYPFPIDRSLADRGKAIFEQNCSRCHGTYGEDWTYPNRIVPLEEIGTDPARHRGLTEKFDAHFNASWFAQGPGGYKGVRTRGYQAPPLDGLWATAPYLHNGSVPTVRHVLNSKARPKVFTRSYRTGKEDYDPVNLGWKFTALERGAAPDLPGIERRKVYDTSQPGRGNGGHTYGDALTDEERRAVIEYLKTL